MCASLGACYPVALLVSRKFILYAAAVAVAVASVLLIAAQRSSLWFVDAIARVFDALARTPWALIFAVLLLVVTALAGTLATLVGMRENKETRPGKRHKTVHARLVTALRRLGL